HLTPICVSTARASSRPARVIDTIELIRTGGGRTSPPGSAYDRASFERLSHTRHSVVAGHFITMVTIICNGGRRPFETNTSLTFPRHPQERGSGRCCWFPGQWEG